MSSSAKVPPVSRTTVMMPVLGVLLVALGAFLGDLVRHDLIEPVERAAACAEAPGAWWCPIRTAVRIASQYYVLAGTALLLAGAAFVRRGRVGRATVVAALFLGGAGLYLYSAGLSAIAVVLALLRTAAFDRA